MAETASRRCAELILQLAGGELLAGVVDVYPGKRAAKKITLTRAEFLRVMGADVPTRTWRPFSVRWVSLLCASTTIAAREFPPGRLGVHAAFLARGRRTRN